MDHILNKPTALPATAAKSVSRNLLSSFSSPSSPNKLGQTPASHSTTLQRPFARTARIDYLNTINQDYVREDQRQSNHYASTTLKPTTDLHEKENLNSPYLTLRDNSLRWEDVECLKAEHRCQIESLLVQLSRMQDLVEQLQRGRRHEVQRVREQLKQASTLQLSSYRQSQFEQNEALQAQNRKQREEIGSKSQQLKRLQGQYEKEKAHFEKDTELLRGELLRVIEKKNADIDAIENECTAKIAQLHKTYLEKQAAASYEHAKQIQDLQKDKNSQQRELDALKKTIDRAQSENKQLEHKFQEFVAQQEKNNSGGHEELEQKCQRLKQSLEEIIEQSVNQKDQGQEQMKKAFKQECEGMLQLLRMKQLQGDRMEEYFTAALQSKQQEMVGYVEDRERLRARLREQREGFARELQLTKVKVATMHEHDYSELVSVYERRLEGLAGNLFRVEEEASRLRAFLNEENARKYETKKKHEIVVAELQSKLLKARMGMNAMESEYRERLENEKSLMLMTSRTLLKEGELKGQNNKFYEQELRKLRQLLDLQANQIENSERNVQQKISHAEQQLSSLRNNIASLTRDKNQEEEAFKQIIKQKDLQIVRLNQELKTVVIPMFDNSLNEKEITELSEIARKRSEQIMRLKDRVLMLENRLNDIQSQMEQFQIEASINQEEAKKHYREISDANLHEHRQFYQGRIESLVYEKGELNKIIQNQNDKIVELIKRYQELEASLKEAVRLIQRRTTLEEKVMQMGLDQCLVANMTSIANSE